MHKKKTAGKKLLSKPKPKVNTVINTQIKKFLQTSSMIEQKRNRYLINGGVALTAGTSLYSNILTGAVVGTADLANRIGDRINLTQIIMRGVLNWTGAGVNHIRVIVFLYNADIAGGNPNDSVMLDDTATNVTRIYGELGRDTFYPKNKRFQILSDRSYQLSSAKPVQTLSKVYKLNKSVQAVAGASFATSGVGIPFVMMLSDSTVVPYVYATASYTDL